MARDPRLLPSTAPGPSPYGLLSLLALTCILLACTCPSGVESVPAPFLGIEPANYEGRLASLVRDYLRIMDKMQAQPKIISGQVNLRAPRSELGDMAHAFKLYQLQELDRTFGSRSRPRFGKRSGEVVGHAGDWLPSYGYDAYYENLQGPDDRRDRDSDSGQLRRR